MLLARGILAWREGQPLQAARDLTQATEGSTAQGQPVWAARAKLHHAHALYLSRSADFPAQLQAAAEDFAPIADAAGVHGRTWRMWPRACTPAHSIQRSARALWSARERRWPAGVPVQGLDGPLTRLDISTLGPSRSPWKARLCH
ncbi:hypothetical protein BXU09_18470 [Deinococcus sp. LM3]|nr:hypothetical protein BXU09_18470 [Deinococcus sp. LM3]